VIARNALLHTAQFVPLTAVPQTVKLLSVGLSPWFGFWLRRQLL